MKSATVCSILLLLVSVVPPVGAAQSDTRLAGFVLGLDGRPADGFRVHLIDDAGNDAVQADVDESGNYRMSGLRSGQYNLALETPDGHYAAVEAPPLNLREGHLVRRDLKLIERDPSAAGLAQPSYNFGTWWAGLTVGAKVWSIAAVVVVGIITADALSSDEAAASEFLP